MGKNFTRLLSRTMSDQLKRNIGLRVRAARSQRGLTQAQLVEAIDDKAFDTISNIERAKNCADFFRASGYRQRAGSLNAGVFRI